ncbi:hypothetical protein Slin15195_G100040 [Septoria linicola]|uniref:Uncharacterized protein n=1 Tax=Septoria linicola TaxID=215465 RepID=A0A9Q9EN39_9PEZI|nr:hypothetical protein Slin15195_G100040 [Septoria linicola]
MAELEQRIQSLAQELQDQILDETLIATTRSRHLRKVFIEPSYRPPRELSLNSRTRQVTGA